MQEAHDWAKNLDYMYKGYGYYKLYTDLKIQFWVNNDKSTLTSI